MIDATVLATSLFLLQLLCFCVGTFYVSKNKEDKDYFLAGRNVSFFPLTMTFVATQIGGGLVLGASEEAFKYGWWVLLYPLGTSLGLLALSLFTGPRLSTFSVSTVAELLGKAFHSPLLRKAASLLSILSLFGILVAQTIASKKFLISLGVDSPLFFVGCWAIVLFYTSLGGLKAVIATDIVQALFFLLVFVVTFLVGSHNEPLLFSSTPFAEIELNYQTMMGWFLMPLFFMLIEQDMAQRCFAAIAPKVVTFSAMAASVIIFFFSAIPIYFGILAKVSGVDPSLGSVLMQLIPSFTTSFLGALVGTAISAAIISTADSLMNAISSNLVEDFSWGLFTSTPKRKLWLGRVLTLLLATLAVACSFYFEGVVSLLVQSYAISVAALFVPVMMVLFFPGYSKEAALASFFGGIGAYFLFFSIPAAPFEILSLLFSFLAFFLGEKYLKKRA